MSEVNWRRWKLDRTLRANACASVVLPTPGTSSINKWPRASRQASERRRTSPLPRIDSPKADSISDILESETSGLKAGSRWTITVMISKLPVLFLLVTILGRAASVEDEVKKVLNKQVAAWNKGDTDGFLDGYASDTVFVGEKMTRGIEDLKKRYQEHYPTRASMGKLSFYDLEIHPMGKDYAYAIGRWQLDRDKEGGGNVSGVYSLVFRRTSIGWKIVLDHTN